MIILRKGGIAEGRAGFAFRHTEFFLFPTLFHVQVEKTRSSNAQLPPARDGEIAIEFFVKLETSALVTSWETAAALEPFHILREEVVRERFAYSETPGLHVASVRVYRLSTPWIISDVPKYGGCRSWVDLPLMPEGTTLQPALTDAEQSERHDALAAILARR